MELIVDIKKKLPGFVLETHFKGGDNIIGLLGASGSGKSMTLRCIAGLENPDSGKIVLNGRTLFDSSKGINLPSRSRKTGFLFQNYALFPHMTIEENIKFGLAGIAKEEQEQKLAHMLSITQLEDHGKRYPAQLSGGQQQRAALARAIAPGPEVLLLDEPFSALDDHLKNQMLRYLKDTIVDFDGVTVFVSHNMEEVYRLCGDLVILADGKTAAAGGTKDVFKAPPNLAAARLTGCKNIAEVVWKGDSQIEVPEWGGVKLNILSGQKKTEKGLNPSYVGIRANYITTAEGYKDENVVAAWVSDTSETQFRMTVYVHLLSPPVKKSDYHLQWEVSKDKWEEMEKSSGPLLLSLKPEKLIIFGE